jgi:hypothetical protein
MLQYEVCQVVNGQSLLKHSYLVMRTVTDLAFHIQNKSGFKHFTMLFLENFLQVSTHEMVFIGLMWQHSLNCIATTRDEHRMCGAIVFLLKNSSTIWRTMLQFLENSGKRLIF